MSLPLAKFLKITLINIAIFALGIAFLELTSFIIVSALNIQNTWNTNYKLDSSENRPIEFLPSDSYSEVSVSRFLEERVIDYKLDEYKRRYDPYLDIDRPEFLILLGDSFIYGVGLDADKTIPSRLNQLQKRYSVFNYGIPGTAPHQYLKRFQQLNIRSEISNQNGALVLLVYDFHILRVSLNLSWTAAASTNQVYYWLDENDELKGGKPLRDSRPVMYLAYRILSHSHLRQLISHIAKNVSDQNREFEDEDYLLYAKLIEQIYYEYKSQFGNDRFYVFYGDHGEISNNRTDIKYLRKKGLKVYTGLQSTLSEPEDRLLDSHYNEVGSLKIAKKILEKLGEIDKDTTR